MNKRDFYKSVTINLLQHLQPEQLHNVGGDLHVIASPDRFVRIHFFKNWTTVQAVEDGETILSNDCNWNDHFIPNMVTATVDEILYQIRILALDNTSIKTYY